MSKIEPAKFIDGEPANLAAAAMDAAEWLEAMERQFGGLLQGEPRAKLGATRLALRSFIAPHLPEEHYVTPPTEGPDHDL